MAFYDASLQLSAAQAITTGAASTLIYDVTGAGSGVAPSMVFGQGQKPGADIANGQTGASPTAVFTVTTTGTGTGTVAFGIEAAPDNGSNSPGTYVRLATSAAYVGTTLLAGNQVILPVPPFAQVAPSMGLPRFYRFFYDQTGNGAVSVSAGIILNPPAGFVSTQYGPAFVAV